MAYGQYPPLPPRDAKDEARQPPPIPDDVARAYGAGSTGKPDAPPSAAERVRLAPPPTPSPASTDEIPWRLILAFVAAALLAIAGWQMVGIRSISGDSINEAFYNAFGYAMFGFAALSLALGFKR